MKTRPLSPGPVLWSDAAGFGLTPEVRLSLVRDYATMIFGKEVAAAAWLGQVHPAVLGGDCTVSVACQTPDGFRAAMQELHRLYEARLAPARPASAREARRGS